MFNSQLNPSDRIVAFEWDTNKREINLSKHGIDFEDVIEVFYGPITLRRSDRNNEERWTAIGSLRPVNHRRVYVADRRHPNYLSAARKKK